MDRFKRVLVMTGGTSGLGLEALVSLARKSHENWRIILGARDPVAAERGVQRILAAATPGGVTVETMRLELEDFKSVQDFAHSVKLTTGQQIHDVVLCAGLVKRTWQETREGHETCLQVNVLAQYWLWTQLLEALKNGARELADQGLRRARLVVVNSELHRTSGTFGMSLASIPQVFGPTGYNGMWAYRASKHIQMQLFQSMHKDNPDLTAFVVSPGFVPSTGLSRETTLPGRLVMQYMMPWMPFATTQTAAGDTIYKAICELSDGDSGQYYRVKQGGTFCRASEECYDQGLNAEYRDWVERQLEGINMTSMPRTRSP